MSISSNKLTITDSSRTVTKIQWVPGSTQVTSGEANTPTPTISQSGRVFTIELSADRSGSSTIANAFNASSGGAAHEYAADGGGGTPAQLNFFFTLQIDFATAQGSGTTQLNVGQGHYAATNNWWLGGSGVATSGSKASLNVIVGPRNDQLVVPMSGTNDSYTFANASIQ